ncbi:uncharacterized protein [Mytilus edulis]|uniref:uncharacterized protein n=1 Tax=Mytilus edulis TaxID=6550 RepID=UPI0039F01A08
MFNMKSILLIVITIVQYTESLQTVKRQGIFGLCQGWGAGCAMDFRSPILPQKTIKQKLYQPIPKSKPDVSFRPHSFFFTSGESWNPIGKRTAWFTDIPFLRNPLLKYPSVQKLPVRNPLSLRYPLVYRSTLAKFFPRNFVVE